MSKPQWEWQWNCLSYCILDEWILIQSVLQACFNSASYRTIQRIAFPIVTWWYSVVLNCIIKEYCSTYITCFLLRNASLQSVIVKCIMRYYALSLSVLYSFAQYSFALYSFIMLMKVSLVGVCIDRLDKSIQNAF